MLRQIDTEKCVGCGACFKACAFDVFRLDTHQPETSPCSAACPAGVDMRDYVHLLQQGKHAEAALSLLGRNPLPLITTLACPHFCEKTCTRKKIDAPVNIPALEAYLAHWMLENTLPLPPISRAGKVLVAGSGAAGLAAAWFMRLHGFEVEIHEKENAPGGALKKAIPAEVLKAQVDFLLRHDIALRTGSPLGDGRNLSPENLLEDHHVKALIIATGAGSAEEFGSVADVRDENLVADPLTCTTRTNGVFACGPVCGGTKDIAHQIGNAFEAAWSANCFANGWDFLQGRPEKKRPVFTMPAELLFPYDPKLPIGNLPPKPRNECRDGAIFDYETMMLEAHRCVTCGAKAKAAYKNDCMTCFFCEIACPVSAIKVNPIKEEIPRTIVFKREGVQKDEM